MDWEGKILTRLQDVVLEIQKVIDSSSLGNSVWSNGIKNWEDEVESTHWKEAVKIPLLGIAYKQSNSPCEQPDVSGVWGAEL